LKKYPAAQWHQYEPLNRDAEFEGARQAFGKFVETQYHFDQAQVVVSFGADFLFALPGSVRYARDWMAGRNIREGHVAMNRLYVLDPVPTITGVSADERRAIAVTGPDGITGHAAALAKQLGVAVSTPGWKPSLEAEAWAATVAGNLKNSPAQSLVIAGAAMPAELHALVHAINGELGNFGVTITHGEPVEVAPVNHTESLTALAESLEAGKVAVLLMLGGNWAHTAPADLEMETLIRQVPLSVALGLYRNETAEAARWHIPQAHPLEAWSDARAFDGTASLAQPLIEPLFGGRTLHELLDCVAYFPGRHAHDIIKKYWTTDGGLDEESWRRALHDGVVANTAAAVQTPTLLPSLAVTLEAKAAQRVELVFAPDYGVWDGRFEENAWLQELPRPISRLSWENALLLSPATAQEQQLATGDVVQIKAIDGRVIRGAALVQPGMADGVLSVTLGCGSRLEPGVWFKGVTPAGDPVQFQKTAQNAGIDAYPLRTSTEPWRRQVTLEKTGERHELVTTQAHHHVNSPDLMRIKPLSSLTPVQKISRSEEPTIYNLTRTATDGLAWGMVVDLTRCIGCNACAAACQAENNIPPVGRREVGRGHEMHWLRVDSYYFDDNARPSIAFQPMPCMHCETAPCELVCPVAATVHDHEGLNVQVYNRCIGTRYCSNNCPYKVRRFNFFNYPKPESKEPLLLAQNPNVTVRTRGVMEKCTYCVQRITAGRISAEVEKRAIRDGEIVPACAQACPTEAIIFGDLNDPQSRVAKLKRTALNYALLGELNTHPRTTYLMRITNPLQP